MHVTLMCQGICLCVSYNRISQWHCIPSFSGKMNGRERKWCWQCEGGNCNEGDMIQVRVCSGNSRQRFVYSSASDARVRFSPVTRRDLCLEMISDRRMRLAKCDSGDSDQLFSGFKNNGDKFELFPCRQSDRVLTQQHDPKSYEEVFAELKETARGDHTSEWVVYKPSGESGIPNPSPTSRPQEQPTSTSSGSCIYNLNLRDNGIIQGGQRIRSPDDSDLYLEQRNDGNLRVTDGGRILWDSGEPNSDGDYWVWRVICRFIAALTTASFLTLKALPRIMFIQTQLQGDGNLITWRGKPKNRESRLWKSNSSSGTGQYFLGLDCDKRYIGIYRGTPSSTGSTVWRDRTGSSSPPAPVSPGPAPTPMPSSQPKIKFRGSDYCSPNNQCGLCEGDCDR